MNVFLLDFYKNFQNKLVLTKLTLCSWYFYCKIFMYINKEIFVNKIKEIINSLSCYFK